MSRRVLKNGPCLVNRFHASRAIIGSSSVRSSVTERTSRGFQTYCRCLASKKNGNGNSVKGRATKDLSSLVRPIPVKLFDNLDGINVGVELCGKLEKDELLKLLNKFYVEDQVQRYSRENGLDDKLFKKVFVSFRRFCVESKALPEDLHVILSDILQGAGHVSDILPFFIDHARQIFPHLDCIDDLRKISDLRLPASWYPDARAIQRKIIFHAGPTNSGKTYHALKRFTTAKSGVYCGPLRMLANEVFRTTNSHGTVCDLITGEERKIMDEEGEPASHVSCTVEMTSLSNSYEVAVIDEIQMLRDSQRGWAWTRAFLGLCTEELHVCGEASAIDLVKELAVQTGDVVEVRNYDRLSKLTVLDYALWSFNSVKPGDCIVCFNKHDIYHCSRKLEKLGKEVAVIYGTLPASTKLAQAAKFNDPDHPCKVLVATDAVGMGINLNIKRVIFYSMVKPIINDQGEKEIDLIPAHMALQIAGRAGRFSSEYAVGEVTTFKNSDLKHLSKLMKEKIEPIVQAGLAPTAEQIELFAYHLPKATLSNLLDIFVNLCDVDNDNFFMCNMDDFKFLAEMIEHIPLELRSRYVFCCSPISRKQPFACTMFLKYVRQYSRGIPITLDWLCRQIGWPFKQPVVIDDLVQLECVFDILDLYLWLSFRFGDMFPDTDHVRDVQKELEVVIQQGVANIIKLLKNTETPRSTGTPDNEDDFEMISKSPVGKKLLFEDENADLEGSDHPLADESQAFLSDYGLVQSKDSSNVNAKLLDKLVKEGLITKSLLQRFKKEIKDDEK